MPKRIKVGYVNYSVLPIDTIEAAEKRISGEARLMRNEIGCVPVLPASKMGNTMLHEILHCICWHHGIDEDDAKEEQYVTLISNGLCSVMIDNPEFFAWLNKVLNAK